MSVKRQQQTGAKRQPGTGKRRGRKATSETRAAQAKDKEALREGTPGRMAERLHDALKRGDMVIWPTESDQSDEDLNEPSVLDAEIELQDEDAAPLDDLDLLVDTEIVQPLRPGEAFVSDPAVVGLVASARYELRVFDRQNHAPECRFVRPSWMRGSSVTASGSDDLDEAGLRFAMFDALAAWLEERRTEYLRTGSPLDLGVDALDEMMKGTPSVVPGAFLELTGIGKLLMNSDRKTSKAKSVESYFSRYTTATALVWGNGRQPLEFLFSHEARLAWVACAIRQFFGRALRRNLDAESIEQLRPISIPKNSAQKDEVRSMSVSSLTASEFVARANMMAGGTSWSEVIAKHFTT